MACQYCNKKVILTPSANERAEKYGNTAQYYRDLFPNHSDCHIAARDNKPNPVNGKVFDWDRNGKLLVVRTMK